MKLILAIVNNDDSAYASASLTEEGFFVTKLSTTGGFLMVGNTTFLIGTQDEDAQKVIDILKQTCKTRKQSSAPSGGFTGSFRNFGTATEVPVGGATIFVLDVAHIEKI